MTEELDSLMKHLGISNIPFELTTSGSDFDPRGEAASLLRAWLLFRGANAQVPEKALVEAVAYEQARNGKPLWAFLDFDPAQASLDFLRAWVANFGITGQNSREFYVRHATRIMKIMRSFMQSRDPLKRFERLQKYRAVRSNILAHVPQIEAALRQAAAEAPAQQGHKAPAVARGNNRSVRRFLGALLRGEHVPKRTLGAAVADQLPLILGRVIRGGIDHRLTHASFGHVVGTLLADKGSTWALLASVLLPSVFDVAVNALL